MFELGIKGKEAARDLANRTRQEKNQILETWAEDLWTHREEILQANEKDLAYGREIGLNSGLMDRLKLDEGRIQGMIDGIQVVKNLEDPIGQVQDLKANDQGLYIGKMTVPIGLIGIIYEARPNVTVDCAALCLKSGSALILRGGKEAIHSNLALAKILRKGLENLGFNPDYVQIIEDTSREKTKELMEAAGLVDLLIPRGSRSLIQACIQGAKVPVLQTGEGNCHVYVDQGADLEMALKIVENAKTQRTGVCNAMESLVLHKDIARDFLEAFKPIAQAHKIHLHVDPALKDTIEGDLALEEDWGREYLDMECSIKEVASLDEAIDHINKYSTGHSEVIVTKDYFHAQEFLKRVDSACVYVNASSRFTDGGQFNMGAEMGISTQKIHARGPVGLEELTSYKYIIYGNGQVRK